MKVENSTGMFLTSISRRESNNPLRSILERPVLSHDKTDGIHARCPLPPVLEFNFSNSDISKRPKPRKNRTLALPGIDRLFEVETLPVPPQVSDRGMRRDRFGDGVSCRSQS